MVLRRENVQLIHHAKLREIRIPERPIPKLAQRCGTRFAGFGREQIIERALQPRLHFTQDFDEQSLLRPEVKNQQSRAGAHRRRRARSQLICRNVRIVV